MAADPSAQANPTATSEVARNIGLSYHLCVRLVAIVGAVLAAALLVWLAVRPPSPQRSTEATDDGWEAVTGLPGMPRSYAEATSSQAAIVAGAAYLRAGWSGPWLKFVSAFRPERVYGADDAIYLFGAETQASTGAPLFLRVLPTPSEVVPLPCAPRDVAIRANVGAFICDRVALLSTDGLRTFARASAAHDKSGFEGVAVSPEGTAWVVHSTFVGSTIEQLGCVDGGVCGRWELPSGVFVSSLQVVSTAERAQGAGFALTASLGIAPDFVSFIGERPEVSLGPPCPTPDGGSPSSVTLPALGTAYYRCNGEVIATQDSGRTFRIDAGLSRRGQATELWGGAGWAAVVAGGKIYRRTVK
jgi:hypothetical protein